MLTTSLPLLPPPSSSLLPPFHASQPDSQPQNTGQNPYQRRPKQHQSHTRSSLAHLSHDERSIAQRKMAIAMYGYSWLKPAGCSKTMLGRREEEIEREEVERQLQEVEMQERNAMMAEEQERAELLRRQAEEEVMGGGDGAEVRDLDDEIPDMDAQDDEGFDDDDEDDGDDVGEEDMDGDLDDEVPDADADADALESGWVYDTNRDPDTESDDDENGAVPPGSASARAGRGVFLGMDSMAETDAMVNAMLDEDEMGEFEQERDLDDSVPDMDTDADLDAEVDYVLDGDVPQADEEGEWQHTDTEFEESEMDISILPPGSARQQPISHPRQSAPTSARQRQRSSNIGPDTTHEEIRRVSGNIMIPPPPPSIQSVSHPPPSLLPPAAHQSRRRLITPNYQTPLTLDNTTPSFSTADDSSPHLFHPSTSTDARAGPSWLHPSTARRKLFGAASTNPSASTTQRSDATHPVSSSSSTTLTSRAVATGRVRSGGLVTPEPPASTTEGGNAEANAADEPRSRTRSGRVVGAAGFAGGRRRDGAAMAGRRG